MLINRFCWLTWTEVGRFKCKNIQVLLCFFVTVLFKNYPPIEKTKKHINNCKMLIFRFLFITLIACLYKKNKSLLLFFFDSSEEHPKNMHPRKKFVWWSVFAFLYFIFIWFFLIYFFRLMLIWKLSTCKCISLHCPHVF